MTNDPAALEACETALGALRRQAGGSGIPKRELFALAKKATHLSPSLVERLLDRDDHDTRIVAVSIMDFQARSARLPQQSRRELFELYLRRHDRIDTWDLVDRSAPYVVGGYASPAQAASIDRPRSAQPQVMPPGGLVEVLHCIPKRGARHRGRILVQEGQQTSMIPLAGLADPPADGHTIPAEIAEIAELAETSSARHTTQRMAGG